MKNEIIPPTYVEIDINPPMPKCFKIGFIIWMIFCIVFLCFSCNIKKDLTKTKEEIKTNVEVKTVSTRTIIETIDTNIVIMADTITGTSWDLTIDPINVETDDIKLIVTKDKNGQFHGVAIQKGKVIPTQRRKLTIENIEEDKRIESKGVIESKQKHKTADSAVKFNMNWIWVIIGGALAVCFGYWFVFIRKKENKTD